MTVRVGAARINLPERDRGRRPLEKSLVIDFLCGFSVGMRSRMTKDELDR